MSSHNEGDGTPQKDRDHRGRETSESTKDKGDTADKTADELTSLDLNNLNQTVDLSELSKSDGGNTLEGNTLDVGVDHGQTVDFTVDLDPHSEKEPTHDGTLLFPPSQAPFDGRVFEPQDAKPPQDLGTRILAPDELLQHTMELPMESPTGDSFVPGSSQRIDTGTVPLTDSQNSSGVSSSKDGRSLYDQTMAISDSNADSKSGLSGSNSGINSNASKDPKTNASGSYRSLADGGQYIRPERSAASDDIINRINRRTISDPLAARVEDPDYEIKTRTNPETGARELHILGEGGMGLVYYATQIGVKRDVALKVIRKDKRSDTLFKQFFYEAEITAKLEHPNITPTYELGISQDGVYFYSMKFIKGKPWDKKIKVNTLEENLDIFDKLCDAIAFAHSRNILHMDIKPDNVQVGEFGEVYAVDWGVASDLSRGEPVKCAGTWQWISPEVALGNQKKIGPPSDIYLLGGVLFLIVTGHHPRLPKDKKEKFGQASLVKAARGNIIQPTECQDPMVKVALKAMETDPKNRYQTVEELQAAIRAIQTERANIRSSQELNERSKTLLAEAEQSGDYDRYVRSIYGFRDAVDLWSGNEDAVKNLKRARLAFGAEALKKEDYNQVSQTLDPNDPDETEIYFQAEKAATAQRLRKQRFTNLIKAFIATMLIGTGVVSYYWLEAVQAKIKAEDAKKVAENAKKVADDERRKAEDERRKAEDERGKAEDAKRVADDERGKAEDAKKVADDERGKAEDAKRVAEDAKEKAEVAKKDALDQKQKAELELARAQFRDITANLGLARSRIYEANPSGAMKIIDSISNSIVGMRKDYNEYVNELSIQKADELAKANEPGNASSTLNSVLDESTRNRLIRNLPRKNNWALDRIKYLANEGISSIKIPDSISALSVASKGQLLVAEKSGRINQFDLRDGSNKPLSDGAPFKDKTILSLTTNAKGDKQFVKALGANGKVSIVTLGPDTKPLSQDPSQEWPSANSLMAISPDGKTIATTINGELLFQRTDDQSSSGKTIIRHPTNENAIDMEWLDDNRLLALVKSDKKRYLMLVYPWCGDASDRCESAEIEIDPRVTQFACLASGLQNPSPTSKTEDIQRVLLERLESIDFLFGLESGALIQSRLKTFSNSPNLNPKKNFFGRVDLPRKHLHPIAEISVEKKPTGDRTARRLITRSGQTNSEGETSGEGQEESIQVWEVSNENNSAKSTRDSIVHLLSMTGSSQSKSTEELTVHFAGFTSDGDVILVNSESQAFKLNIEEQVRRQKVLFDSTEDPNKGQLKNEWIFNRSGTKEYLRVDSSGAVTLHNSLNGKTLQSAVPESDPQTFSLQAKPIIAEKQVATQVTNGEFINSGATKPFVHQQLHATHHYWGHTPSATLQDYAIFGDGGYAITLASINPDIAKSFLDMADLQSAKLPIGEICIWDLTKAQMLQRLSFASENSLQNISQLDQDRFVLGDKMTLSVIGRGSPSVLNEDNTKAAVQSCVLNPRFPNCNAFFSAREGEKCILWLGGIAQQGDASNGKAKWISIEANRLSKEAKQVAGCWSKDGRRLYILFNDGSISRYQLDPERGELSIDYSKNSPDQLPALPTHAPLLAPLGDRSNRFYMGIGELDQEKNTSGNEEVFVMVAPRLLTNSTKIRTFSAIFHTAEKPTEWTENPQATDGAKDFYKQANTLLRLVSTKKSDRDAFAKPIDATANSEGTLVGVLHKEAIFFLSLEKAGQANSNPTNPSEINAKWHRLSLSADLQGTQQIELSTDGKQLAIRVDNKWKILNVNRDPANGSIQLQPTPDLENATHFAWNPEEDGASYAFVRTDGTVWLQGGAEPIHNLLLADNQIKSDDKLEPHEAVAIKPEDIRKLWFFKEVLVDESKEVETPPSRVLRYLAVSTRNNDGNIRTRFIKLGQPAIEQPNTGNESETSTSKISLENYPVELTIKQAFNKFTVNPKGGIIVTGDEQGTVTSYLASPFWLRADSIFDANSEADSAILDLTFSEDGDTLLISNNNGNVFGLRTKTEQSK